MAFSNEDIMNEIKKNLNETKEIKTTLEKALTVMEDMMGQFTELKIKCENLEEKNTRLSEQVKYLNSQVRKNNFVIYNVPKTENEDIVEKVKEICLEAEITVSDQEINNCFRIGKGADPRPVLVSLSSNLLKRKIFSKREYLQQKHYRLNHDRTLEEREEGRRIFACLSKLKSLDSSVMYRNRTFKFRGDFYTLKEVEELIKGGSLDTATTAEQMKKRLKLDSVKERLGPFRFRPSSPSPSSVKSFPG